MNMLGTSASRPTIEIRQASALGGKAIKFAVSFIGRHFPDVSRHLFKVARQISANPTPCPTAWGCVSSRSPWVIFVKNPERIALRELVITVMHEAVHVDIDAWGRWYIRYEHECEAHQCALPHVRARDPVYVFEDRLAPLVDRGLRAEGFAPMMSAQDQEWTISIAEAFR